MALRRYDGPTLTLVVNPSAGRGRAKRLLPKVCTEILTGLPGANLRVFQTHDFAEARLRTIAAAESARAGAGGMRPDALIVMGGDGMMHLGLNACAQTGVPLGMIPAGTGNDFCSGTGAATTVGGAVRAIIGGATRRIDLMQVSGQLEGGAQHRFVGSVLSTGYDALVNERTNHMRTFGMGSVAYAYAALAELASFEPIRYQVHLDGKPRSQVAMFVAVGNAGYFGGGMRVCPQADVTDGLLDVTIINPVSRATLLRLLPFMYSGRFVRDPAVEMLRAREVRVDGSMIAGMADGERLGTPPFTATAVPDALTIFVPRAR